MKRKSKYTYLKIEIPVLEEKFNYINLSVLNESVGKLIEAKDEQELENILKSTNINSRLDNGITALMYLALQGTKEQVELFLKYKADTNLQDKIGNNALIYSIMRKDESIMKALLEESTENINKANIGNLKPIDIAIKYNSQILINTLIDYGADYSNIFHNITNNKSCNDYITKEQSELAYSVLIHINQKGLDVYPALQGLSLMEACALFNPNHKLKLFKKEDISEENVNNKIIADAHEISSCLTGLTGLDITVKPFSEII